MNCTSIEQSKRLVDLGLDPNTADMFHLRIVGETYDKYGELIPLEDNLCKVEVDSPNRLNYPKDDMLPCWSVSALMDLLPEIRINYHLYKWRYSLESLDYIGVSSGKILHSITSNGVLNKFYDMIVWLLENKYI